MLPGGHMSILYGVGLKTWHLTPPTHLRRNLFARLLNMLGGRTEE